MSSAQTCPLAKLDKILIATDRSAFSEGAVREGIKFAKRCSSALTIMTVLETNPEYETIGAGVYQQEEKEAAAYLASVKDRARQEDLVCETVLAFGQEPYQQIVEEAAEQKADIIVIGRRGRTGLMKVLMGKVAAKVIGHAPCKTLVVPRAAQIACRNILVATDGSRHSIAAAAEAVEIARRCGSGILALSTSFTSAELPEADTLVKQVVETARSKGVAVETLTSLGRSHEVIVETAGGRGVDLIVMGAYGKTGLKKLLMGSSTERVIGRASCAVLVVP